MGTLNSKDTRRISFNNTFALSPVMEIQMCNDDDVDDDLALSSLSAAKNNCPFSDFREKKENYGSDPISKEIESVKLKENDETNYWSNRIECLKNEHQIINKTMEIEYENTINSTKLFELPRLTHERIQEIKPCLDLQAKILKCYEINSHQPLVCSAEVQAFSDCVTSFRVQQKIK